MKKFTMTLMTAVWDGRTLYLWLLNDAVMIEIDLKPFAVAVI